MFRLTLFVVILMSIMVSMTGPGHATEDITAVEQLDFANGLFQRGIYNMAITEYEKFIKLFPDNEYVSDAYFGIAESLYFAKRYKDAVEAYNKYAQRFPNGDKASVSGMRIGAALFYDGRYDEAIRQLGAVETSGMSDDLKQGTAFYTAKAYSAKGDTAKALESFGGVLAISDKGEYAIYSLLDLGKIYSERSEYDKAYEYYNKAYEAADASDENKSLAYFKMAEIQFASGDYEASAYTFKRLLEDYPGSNMATASLANLLLALYNLGEYTDLITEYIKGNGVIKQANTYFDIYIITATAYGQLQQYKESLLMLDGLASSDWLSRKNLIRVLFKKTEILIKSGAFKEALEFIDNKLASYTDYTDNIYFLKAEALYGLKKFEDAGVYYNMIIKEFKDSGFYQNAIYGMAYVDKDMGNKEEARKLFRDYFRDAKKDVKAQRALYNLIMLDADMDDLKQAIEDSKTFLATFDKGTLVEKVMMNLGRFYSESRSYAEAIDTYRRYIQDHPESERSQEAYFSLAYNLQMSGNIEEALRYYEMIAPADGKKGLYAMALKNTALIYFDRDDEANAAGIYEKIIDGVEDSVLDIDAYIWLARYYFNNKRYKDSLRILEDAQKVEGVKDNYRQIAYIKAESYRNLKEFQNAISDYDKVLSDKIVDTLSGGARIGKGLCLLESDDLNRAKFEFETAILQNQDDNTITMRARFEMANIEYARRNFQEANKFYMLVAILYDDETYSPQALFKSAEISTRLGETAQAKKSYKELLGRYPESELAAQTSDRLRELNEVK